MPQLAAWIERAVVTAGRGPLDDAAVAKELDTVAGEIRDLLSGFPMPGYVA
jgi:glycine hydroxymethyltransferase